MLPVVDDHPAELLPGLYREVLDAVAALEVTGHRAQAARVREEATRAYSKAWNQVAARRLRRLRDDARRQSGMRQRARPLRPWQALRRRSVESRPA
jgi:hypothetical protein